MGELTFRLFIDEVSRVLPSLVIQDQDDSPRPKIAAHVTGSYIPEKDGGGMRFFSVSVLVLDYYNNYSSFIFGS